tara:strand:- start:731 stop:1165 length:435 start_codon:yes stop_codon:yes gene_type:complete
MTYRTSRKKKTIKDKLSNGDAFKVVARPSKFPNGGYLWLVSMAASKSNRAINDWIKERNKRKIVKKLNYFYPKKRDVKALRIAVNAAKKWIAEIPEGDCLVFRAEGAKADQLFRIYKKWFKTHENIPWVISEEHKSFFFYRKRS